MCLPNYQVHKHVWEEEEKGSPNGRGLHAVAYPEDSGHARVRGVESGGFEFECVGEMLAGDFKSL